MCGRFAVGAMGGQEWADWLGVDRDSPWPEPSWNVAPTQAAAVVVPAGGGRRLMLARWGLVPRWWRRPLAELRASTFNARAEEAAEKPMFRDAWKRGRCLVPCIGYYEWSGTGTTKSGAKRAFFVTLRGNAPGFCMAGLWARASVEGATLTSFTVLTCAAGPATRSLHPRSPVVIGEADWDRWLTSGPEAAELMHPAPDDRVELREVSPAVGNVRNDGPELIAARDAGR